MPTEAQVQTAIAQCSSDKDDVVLTGIQYLFSYFQELRNTNEEVLYKKVLEALKANKSKGLRILGERLHDTAFIKEWVNIRAKREIWLDTFIDAESELDKLNNKSNSGGQGKRPLPILNKLHTNIVDTLTRRKYV